VRAWQAWVPDLPDALFSICFLGAGTSPTVAVSGQLLGPESRLRQHVAPLERVDGARLTFHSYSYLYAQLRWAGCLGKTDAECHLAGESPHGTLGRASFRAKSDYMNEPLKRAGIETALGWIERVPAAGFGSGSLILDSYGGAINRVKPGATAFVHRNAICSGQYLAYWYSPAGAKGATAWIRGFHAAMRPHVSGFAYQNYIDRDLTSWRHAYYGANYERLRAVKRQFDPDWFFRFPQAIEPAER
jgi:hypothetical protein